MSRTTSGRGSRPRVVRSTSVRPPACVKGRSSSTIRSGSSSRRLSRLVLQLTMILQRLSTVNGLGGPLRRLRIGGFLHVEGQIADQVLVREGDPGFLSRDRSENRLDGLHRSRCSAGQAAPRTRIGRRQRPCKLASGEDHWLRPRPSVVTSQCRAGRRELPRERP